MCVDVTQDARRAVKDRGKSAVFSPLVRLSISRTFVYFPAEAANSGLTSGAYRRARRTFSKAPMMSASSCSVRQEGIAIKMLRSNRLSA